MLTKDCEFFHSLTLAVIAPKITSKMKVNNTFFIFLVLIFSNFNAQINIEARTSVTGQKFKIEINKNSEKYFINLQIRDSISKNKSFQNEMEILRKEYFAIEDASFTNDSVKAILNKMNILTEKNTLYSTFKTEISKKDYREYDNLVNLFYKENGEFFERRTENKNRVVFDGTSVKIIVTDGEKTKNIWSRSPTKNSHPEIRNLLTSTLEILRSKNILPIDKSITSGY